LLGGSPNNSEFDSFDYPFVEPVAKRSIPYRCVWCDKLHGGLRTPYCPECFVKSPDSNGGIPPIPKIIDPRQYEKLREKDMNETRLTPSFVGPHEGRELELMLAGTKPLCMFVEEVPCEVELFPEAEFDALVAEGRLLKNVSSNLVATPQGTKEPVRRVLYCLPHEEWRINAMMMILQLYHSLSPGWRPDLDRAIGLLLGYERADIERFLEWHGLSKSPLMPPLARLE